MTGRVVGSIPATAARQSASSGAVSFPKVTSASWGTIVCLVYYDAPTGGNMLAAFAPASSKTFDVNDQPQFDLGDLTITDEWTAWS